MGSLQNSKFWEDKLADVPTKSPDSKVHLILSLVIYLSVSIRHLLTFIFTSDIKPVKDRAARFLGYTPTHTDPDGRFPMAHIFLLWLEQCTSPVQQEQILLMITPVAKAAVLADSNNVSKDVSLQKLADKYRALAPFFFKLVYVFVASPNDYRKDHMKQNVNSESPSGGEGDEAARDWQMTQMRITTRPDIQRQNQHHSGRVLRVSAGILSLFRALTDAQAIILVISMLMFVRNRATNLLPLLLCLFLKIPGTTTRVDAQQSKYLRMRFGSAWWTSRWLWWWGATLSCLFAGTVALARSGRMFLTTFDNISISLRKSQQRLTNRNSIIHATNVALSALKDVDPKAEDLQAKLDLRGEHKWATVEDILPTTDDDVHMEQSFTALIAEMIVLYCLGSGEWKDRKEMLEAIEEMMPKDCPSDSSKTDVLAFGVLDVNEGSKKGVIKVIDGICERSTLSKTEWASKTHMIQGDWLTSNNFRNGRHIRKDDINTYE
ncbi:hypothetical protein C8R43DRAFT_944818 [Mycena crocata]|nr:hypothetical protein C8R43DRAFT_944818 [Mycena crocata]